MFREPRLLVREVCLAKHHYSHDKRMREIAKKKKQEEKRQRRYGAKQDPQADEGPDPSPAEE
jgi:hypothetical protein